jgi:hypothetical protein
MVVTGPYPSDWHEADLDFAGCQKAVGGYVEPLAIPQDRATVFINEEGALDRLPCFTLWTRPDGIVVDALHGPVVILGPADDEGNMTPLTDEALRFARLYVRPLKQRELGAVLTDGTPCKACNGSGYQPL